VIIEQHRAQDAALRFDIAGKRSFEGYVSGSRHFALVSPIQLERASPISYFGSLRLRSFQSEIFVSGLRAHRIVGNICGRVKDGLRVVNVEITPSVQKPRIIGRRRSLNKKGRRKGAPEPVT
jgi:hypothetical protein